MFFLFAGKQRHLYSSFKGNINYFAKLGLHLKEGSIDKLLQKERPSYYAYPPSFFRDCFENDLFEGIAKKSFPLDKIASALSYQTGRKIKLDKRDKDFVDIIIDGEHIGIASNVLDFEYKLIDSKIPEIFKKIANKVNTNNKKLFISIHKWDLDEDNLRFNKRKEDFNYFLVYLSPSEMERFEIKTDGILVDVLPEAKTTFKETGLKYYKSDEELNISLKFKLSGVEIYVYIVLSLVGLLNVYFGNNLLLILPILVVILTLIRIPTTYIKLDSKYLKIYRGLFGIKILTKKELRTNIVKFFYNELKVFRGENQHQLKYYTKDGEEIVAYSSVIEERAKILEKLFKENL